MFILYYLHQNNHNQRSIFSIILTSNRASSKNAGNLKKWKKDKRSYIRGQSLSNQIIIHSTKFILNDANKNLLPKWLISSIYYQLQEIGETKEIDSVLEEVFNIKGEIGSPSLSTPIGQIIGSQAILNTVISDRRWEILCDEIKKLIWGYFGKLPRKIDKKILEIFSNFSVLTWHTNRNYFLIIWFNSPIFFKN